ncbi:MAG: hypothetical protein J5835_04295 [Bacteroidales bacterium]|nr:hypothetical protein [Bacteroidales bacterium]
MKKAFLHILPLICGAIAAVSCARETVDVPEEGEGIVLDFFCTRNHISKGGMNGTRDSETEWNENLISTLDIFYYPDEGLDSDCVLHKRFTPNESDGDATVTTYTTDDFISGTLIPGANTSFWVYAIANYPGVIVSNENDLSSTSYSDLQNLSLNCDFSVAANHKQSSFVMDGLTEVTNVDKDKRLVAKGLIELRRVAAKITVQLNIASQISIPKEREQNESTIQYYERWEPMLGGLQMYLENGVCNTKMDAKPVDDPIYFSYSGNRMIFRESSDPEDASHPLITDPTYVYPQRWEYASKDSPTKEPTIKLILPWKRLRDDANNVGSTQKQFYYKIIIPDDTRAATEDQEYLMNFVRNNWYQFKMTIAMLGSETDEATVYTEGQYFVLDWQDKDVVIKQAVIGKARFLSIEPKEHELSNVPDLDMMFHSSHPVALNTEKGGSTLDITATKVYYGTKNAGESYSGGTIMTAGANHPDYPSGQKYVNYDAGQRATVNGGREWVYIDGDYVKFYHSLDNNMSDKEFFDCSPYIVRFSLYHADHNDDSIYKESVKITQKPAMYITAEQSNGSVWVNTKQYTGTSSSVTVYAGNGSSGDSIGTIVKTSSINNSDDNTNQYQYTVYVTVLPSDSEYIIGDPRTDGSSAIVTNINNLNSSANYRPADTSINDYIAPAIKIASSYGKTGEMSYDLARARCSAYQENGYPAGRWRLPTKAEVFYLIKLSQEKLIRTLFTPGADLSEGGYWCSDGVVYPMDDGSIDYRPTAEAITYRETNWPRCVYDVWYWGEDKDSSHLTSWGGFQTTK